MAYYLGRGLISAYPNSDGCEFDERQIVGCEFVISGRATPTLFDLVEEAFDQVARPIQIRAEANRVFAISFRRNVCPCSLLAGKLPDPVCVVSTIREEHRLWRQGTQKNRTQPVVMRLTRREGEMNRQAVGV